MDCGSSEDAVRRSLELSEVARSGLRARGIAPTPRNYEIWYAYAQNRNRALSQDIEKLLAGAAAPEESDLERLHETHFGAARMLGKVDSIGSGISARLGDVVEFMTATLGTTSKFGDRLDTASQHIAGSDDPRAILSAVKSLIAATLEMRKDSDRLRSRLDGAMREISDLQHGLHAIRMESRLDPLTEVGNRKLFDEAIGEAIRGSAERATPLALLMIDIDHFKLFNDTYGHATGDQVLRLVAATLKQNIKGADIAARYGGEEFAIILPNTALQQAMGLADQIRRTVMARELKKKSTGEVIGRITISVGVAALLGYDTRDSLVERADGYLYAAKRGGRNRVVGPVQFETQLARIA